MTIKKLSVLLILSGSTAFAYSQADFGIWYGASAEHKLIGKLGLDLSGEIRTHNNASRIDEIFLEGGLSYKFNKYVSVGGSYRYTWFHEVTDDYHARYKWFVDINGHLPLGDFDITGRVRFQERYKTYFQDENDRVPKSTLRYRLKLSYNIPSCPVNPFAFTEIFCPVSSDKKRSVEKERFAIGAEYKISKKHSVDAAYMFERDYLPHLSDINLISLEYNLKF
jgi:Protein of unknown function (DUF2490)